MGGKKEKVGEGSCFHIAQNVIQYLEIQIICSEENFFRSAALELTVKQTKKTCIVYLNAPPTFFFKTSPNLLLAVNEKTHRCANKNVHFVLFFIDCFVLLFEYILS